MGDFAVMCRRVEFPLRGDLPFQRACESANRGAAVCERICLRVAEPSHGGFCRDLVTGGIHFAGDLPFQRACESANLDGAICERICLRVAEPCHG